MNHFQLQVKNSALSLEITQALRCEPRVKYSPVEVQNDKERQNDSESLPQEEARSGGCCESVGPRHDGNEPGEIVLSTRLGFSAFRALE